MEERDTHNVHNDGERRDGGWETRCYAHDTLPRLALPHSSLQSGTCVITPCMKVTQPRLAVSPTIKIASRDKPASIHDSANARLGQMSLSRSSVSARLRPPPVADTPWTARHKVLTIERSRTATEDASFEENRENEERGALYQRGSVSGRVVTSQACVRDLLSRR